MSSSIQSYLVTLNTREIASIVWLFIFVFFLFTKEYGRRALSSLLKAFFQKKILVVLFLAGAYIVGAIALMEKYFLWDYSLLPDTFIWVFGTAFVLLMNMSKASSGQSYFGKALLDNLKLVAVLEFVMNIYTFNLITELVLVPFMFFLLAMNAIAESDNKYSPVKKVIDAILVSIGSIFILITIHSIYIHFSDFASIATLNKFILPAILTVAYIPFFYIFVLLATYEVLFVRLNTLIKEKQSLADYFKFKIILLCHMNLRKLNELSRFDAERILNIKSEEEVLNYLRDFRASKRNKLINLA